MTIVYQSFYLHRLKSVVSHLRKTCHRIVSRVVMMPFHRLPSTHAGFIFSLYLSQKLSNFNALP